MTSSWVAVTAGIVILVWTLLPLSRSPRWWVRAFEFPRAQLAVIGLIAALFVCWEGGLASVTDRLIVALIVGCSAYQALRIFPYIPLGRHQIAAAAVHEPQDRISILVANVLMTNRDAGRLAALIQTHEPDLLLTLESDDWWGGQLDRFAGSYPYHVCQPQDDTYGMHLYSRLEIAEHQVRFLVETNVPSIHASIRLRNGQLVDLRCLHPAPPSPTENDTSSERDAELLLVARDVDASAGPVIVTGDMNDVAWSSTTRLFQRVSGLLDPRIGRGIYGTFHALAPYLRWPLDHVFVSSHFTLAGLRVLPAFGSDHLPVLVEFQLAPDEEDRHDPPSSATAHEHALAREKIAEVDVDPELRI